jgi:hypothetical protein
MRAIRTFPLEGPIRPEGRQIGRGPAIDGLEKQVIENQHATLLLAGRRVGKTSMAEAVLDRMRATGAWALEADLSRTRIASSGDLAAHLAEQARAAGVHVTGKAVRAGRAARKVAAIAGSPAVRAAAKVLGLDEAAEASQVAAAIDQALAPIDADGEVPDLAEVLAAIAAAAVASDRVVIIFIDEIQELAANAWERNDSLYVQRALAEAIEYHDGIVFLLAGSDRTAVEKLMAPGQPLHFDGMNYPVPEISRDDWMRGLRERFAEIGVEIGDERIDQILAASAGHPQNTMRVCAHIQQLVGEPFDTITDVMVRTAIETAKGHPSWI